MQTPFKIARKDTKRVFSPMQKAVKDIAKQAINRGAVNGIIRTGLDRLTASQAF